MAEKNTLVFADKIKLYEAAKQNAQHIADNIHSYQELAEYLEEQAGIRSTPDQAREAAELAAIKMTIVKGSAKKSQSRRVERLEARLAVVEKTVQGILLEWESQKKEVLFQGQ